jgi:glycosyltransferase involved in cell wall biosynthesis
VPSPVRSLDDLPPPPAGASGWPWTVEPASPPADGASDGPTISVVTPSFNQARFLEATIRSVLLQGYPRLEYFVLDGGSTDGSREVIERYAPHLAGWSSAKDGGQGDAINAGFARATGDVLAWLNSDDRYLPGTLARVARQVVANPDAAAWIGASRAVDDRGRLLSTLRPRGLALPTLAEWSVEARFAQPASFYRRDVALRAGPLDVTLRSSFDVDFFLRLARQGRFVGTDELWVEETVHPDAKTSAQPGRSLAELHAVQVRQGFLEIAVRQMTSELQELWDRRHETVGQDLLRRVRSTARHHLSGLLGPDRTRGT